MQKLEINNQPAVIFDTRSELKTAKLAVMAVHGCEHFLIQPNPAETQVFGAANDALPDRRLTLSELEAIDGEELAKTPPKYPLIGVEAKVIIRALGHQARQPKDWLQLSAMNALKSMGSPSVKLDRVVSAARTAGQHLLPKHFEPMLRQNVTAELSDIPAPLPPKHFTPEEVTQIVKEVPNLVLLLNSAERTQVDTLTGDVTAA